MINDAQNERKRAVDRFEYCAKKIDQILALDFSFCSFVNARDFKTRQEFEGRFETYSTSILSNIKDIFTVYTGGDCAVAIKALNLTSNVNDKHLVTYSDEPTTLPPFVYTFDRDQSSKLRRAHIDSSSGLDIYEYNRNAGLVNATSPTARGYWYCNDLPAMGRDYYNKNGEWSSLYHATAITLLRTPMIEKHSLPIGFLCIDNFEGGFDDHTCRYVMDILANILYYSLGLSASVIESFERI